MNYPLEQLVIIGPILFLVLMIAFPVIGVFGGWKRAAYWGGGNFIFYIIGLLVWRYTSGGIVNLFEPLLQQLTEQADFSKIAIAIAAPAYFLIVLIVANLFLLINYYAWFKRVVGLKKVKTVKKKGKDGKVTKTKVAVQHNYSTGYKVMSHIVGGVGMGALMLPTTFAFTQAVMYTTTSVTTRKTNGFASDLYDMLYGVNDKMSWLSYYSSDSAKDYDALFAGLAMRTKEINVQLPWWDEEKSKPVIDVVAETFGTGVGNVYETIQNAGDEEAIKESVDELVGAWNIIMENAADEMSALFNSDDAADVMKDLLEIPDSFKAELDETMIQGFIGTGDEPSVIQQYIEDYSGTVEPLTISQTAYNNIMDEVMSMYSFKDDEGITQEMKDEFEDTIKDMIGLLFKV